LIYRIEQAATSNHPASLFDAATAVRYAAMFNLSKRETRHLERHLRGLVRKASKLIQDTFPIIGPQERSNDFNLSDDKDEDRIYVHGTTDRAHYDTHIDGYSTYLRIPDDLPWETEEDASRASANSNAVVPNISVTNVSLEWIEALVKHYELSGELSE